MNEVCFKKALSTTGVVESMKVAVDSVVVVVDVVVVVVVDDVVVIVVWVVVVWVVVVVVVTAAREGSWFLCRGQN